MFCTNVLVMEPGSEIADFLAVSFPERSWILGGVRNLEELRKSLAQTGPGLTVSLWQPRFWPLLEWLAAHRPEVPVVLLSDAWPNGLHLHLQSLGTLACLRWPKDKPLLVETVQRFVQARQSPTAIRLA